MTWTYIVTQVRKTCFFFPSYGAFVWAGFVGENFEVRPKELKHLSIDFDSPSGLLPGRVWEGTNPRNEKWRWTGRPSVERHVQVLLAVCKLWVASGSSLPSQEKHDDFCEQNFLRQSFAVGFSVFKKNKCGPGGGRLCSSGQMRMTIKNVRLLHAAKRGRA